MRAGDDGVVRLLRVDGILDEGLEVARDDAVCDLHQRRSVRIWILVCAKKKGLLLILWTWVVQSYMAHRTQTAACVLKFKMM